MWLIEKDKVLPSLGLLQSMVFLLVESERLTLLEAGCPGRLAFHF